jgi:cytochrome c-type biogenesis protein CcmH
MVKGPCRRWELKRSSLGFIFSVITLLLLTSFQPGEAKELTWQDVAKELMSPACPGRLVIDCPSGEADQLRTLIKQKVDEGWTKKQIMQYFANIYGEEYLAAPAKRGFYLLAWIVPFVVVAVGAFVVLLVMRIWKRTGQLEEEEAASAALPEGEKGALSEKLDEELNKFDF